MLHMLALHKLLSPLKERERACGIWALCAGFVRVLCSHFVQPHRMDVDDTGDRGGLPQ